MSQRTYEEFQGDLILAATECAIPIVHCINADCRLGAGIARAIEQRWHIARELLALHPRVGAVIPISRQLPDTGQILWIFNLVTKQSPHDKPTYEIMQTTLIELRKLCTSGKYPSDIIGMPRIGCGLDCLDWKVVRRIIQETFNITYTTTFVRVYIL